MLWFVAERVNWTYFWMQLTCRDEFKSRGNSTEMNFDSQFESKCFCYRICLKLFVCSESFGPEAQLKALTDLLATCWKRAERLLQNKQPKNDLNPTPNIHVYLPNFRSTVHMKAGKAKQFIASNCCCRLGADWNGHFAFKSPPRLQLSLVTSTISWPLLRAVLSVGARKSIAISCKIWRHLLTLLQIGPTSSINSSINVYRVIDLFVFALLDFFIRRLIEFAFSSVLILLFKQLFKLANFVPQNGI